MMLMLLLFSGSSHEQNGQVAEPGGGRVAGAGMFQLGLAGAKRHVAALRSVQRRRVQLDVEDDRRRPGVRSRITADHRARRLVRLQQVRLCRRQQCRLQQRHRTRPGQRSTAGITYLLIYLPILYCRCLTLPSTSRDVDTAAPCETGAPRRNDPTSCCHHFIEAFFLRCREECEIL